MVTVAIHQPNFFPWVGYFEKIIKSDFFVFLDDVQYSSGTNFNRVMIETTCGTERLPNYITCPVHAHFPTKIKDVVMAHRRWIPKVQRTLMWEYGGFRAYPDCMPPISSMLHHPSTNLSQYNIHNIIQMCSLLGIKPRKGFLVQSELDILGEHESTELILDILGYLGATEYYSGVGALSYLKDDLFVDAGIKVTYQNILRFPPYSIIQILMRIGKNGVLELIS